MNKAEYATWRNGERKAFGPRRGVNKTNRHDIRRILGRHLIWSALEPTSQKSFNQLCSAEQHAIIDGNRFDMAPLIRVLTEDESLAIPGSIRNVEPSVPSAHGVARFADVALPTHEGGPPVVSHGVAIRQCAGKDYSHIIACPHQHGVSSTEYRSTTQQPLAA
jgi:hypothetical protein